MEKEQHEQYEYARRRIKQKKNLYFHFVLLVLGCLFLFIANVLLHVEEPKQWYMWVITVWILFFILHFIKVYITDRFMNKRWERQEIDRLIAKQQHRTEQLELKVNGDLPQK